MWPAARRPSSKQRTAASTSTGPVRSSSSRLEDSCVTSRPVQGPTSTARMGRRCGAGCQGPARVHPGPEGVPIPSMRARVRLTILRVAELRLRGFLRSTVLCVAMSLDQVSSSLAAVINPSKFLSQEGPASEASARLAIKWSSIAPNKESQHKKRKKSRCTQALPARPRAASSRDTII